MQGYKVFKPDWTCRGFQYEVGKTYTHEGIIGLCSSGFHFCKNLVNCFDYYDFNPNNKVAKVVAEGSIVEGKDKCVTDKITIVEELNWHQVLDMANIGCDNEGYGNVGRNNIGNFNAGRYNYGSRNTEDKNVGDWNSGTANEGYYNSGDLNIGDFNSGFGNIGNRNIGYFNVGNDNYGIFNTSPRKMTIFNKETDLTFKELKDERVFEVLVKLSPTIVKWNYFENMTELEKSKIPQAKTTGGYLKENIEYKRDIKNVWDSLDNSDKQLVLNLPNFDADIFFEITGIDVRGE